jgi:hypothetical protein
MEKPAPAGAGAGPVSSTGVETCSSRGRGSSETWGGF